MYEEMSKLLDKQVNVQNESSFRGSSKLPQAQKKCAMKMKEEKNDCRVKIIVVKERTL